MILSVELSDIRLSNNMMKVNFSARQSRTLMPLKRKGNVGLSQNFISTWEHEPHGS